ncbi:hypothetical protein L1887_47932 [Cichorium endivia]|nr:hypothetical protein L1887_47932 [Cichorium endivia]
MCAARARKTVSFGGDVTATTATRNPQSRSQSTGDHAEVARRLHPEMAAIGLMIISMGISMSEMYSAITEGTERRIWQVHVVGMSALVLKDKHVQPPSQIGEIPHCSAFEQLSALDCLLGLAFHVPILLSAEKAMKSSIRRPDSTNQLTRELDCLAKTLNNWLEAFSKGDPRMEQAHDSSPEALDTNDKLTPEVPRRIKPAKLFDLNLRLAQSYLPPPYLRKLVSRNTFISVQQPTVSAGVEHQAPNMRQRAARHHYASGGSRRDTVGCFAAVESDASGHGAASGCGHSWRLSDTPSLLSCHRIRFGPEQLSTAPLANAESGAWRKPVMVDT